MKTAISLPDDLFYAAEETAEELGIPRSRLIANALREFISTHRKEHITEQLNRVYEKMDKSMEMNMSKASMKTLRELTRNDTW
jgi:metal-responsive CopG/Arc/MetJ family transcriptional regulator